MVNDNDKRMVIHDMIEIDVPVDLLQKVDQKVYIVEIVKVIKVFVIEH